MLSPPFSAGGLGLRPEDYVPLDLLLAAAEILERAEGVTCVLVDGFLESLSTEECVARTLSQEPDFVLLAGSGNRLEGLVVAARLLNEAFPCVPILLCGEAARIAGRELQAEVGSLEFTHDGSPVTAAHTILERLGMTLRGGDEASRRSLPWHLLDPSIAEGHTFASLPVPLTVLLPGATSMRRSVHAVLDDLKEASRRFHVRRFRCVRGALNADACWLENFIRGFQAECSNWRGKLQVTLDPLAGPVDRHALVRLAGLEGVEAILISVRASTTSGVRLRLLERLTKQVEGAGLDVELEVELGGRAASRHAIGELIETCMRLRASAAGFTTNPWPWKDRGPGFGPRDDVPYLEECRDLAVRCFEWAHVDEPRRERRARQTQFLVDTAERLQLPAVVVALRRLSARGPSSTPWARAVVAGGDGTMREEARETLVWTAPLFDPSGYAEDARTLIDAADRSGVRVRANEMRWSNRAVPLTPARRARFDRLLATPVEGDTIHLVHGFPSHFHRAESVKRNIGRTMFETDQIPDVWVARCHAMDEVWVPSTFNVETFSRSGVPLEKLRLLPMALDDAFLEEDVEPLERDADRFTFLSIFDWSSRKGWDLLLTAFAREFGMRDDVRLLLKVHSSRGESVERLRERVHAFLAQRVKGDPSQYPRIDFVEGTLASQDMPRLYRSVDAFVLPTRGEGWGRPLMEAMAAGLPTIATRWSGQLDFMHPTNSYLIDCAIVPVPAEAIQEAPLFRGHRWAEPIVFHLADLMRQVYERRAAATEVGRAARREMLARFDKETVGKRVRELIEGRDPDVPHREPIALPHARARKTCEREIVTLQRALHRPMRVQWEGPFHRATSLAKVNRELTARLADDASFDVEVTSLDAGDAQGPELVPATLGRAMETRHAQPDLRIVHRWPPRLQPEGDAPWVWIQPWEYGSLPSAWIEPLRDHVAEVWAPSRYVRDLYREAGVPSEKIFLVPNGVDVERYHPAAPAMRLPTSKSFRFLFVGGTIWRKGIDAVLTAYTSSFRREDDVSLIIKDVGGEHVYRGRNAGERIRELRDRPDAPEIIHVERDLDEDEMIALYRACHVLVHPYRGEGFAMPVLEAMACGVPVIVTRGGATDDFCDDRTAYRVPASRRFLHTDKLQTLERPWVLEPDLHELARWMRLVVGDPRGRERRARLARERVALGYSWDHVARIVKRRCLALAMGNPQRSSAGRDRLAKRCTLLVPEDRENVSVQTDPKRVPVRDVRGFAYGVESALAEVRTPWVLLASCGVPDGGSWLERLDERRGSADALLAADTQGGLLLARADSLRRVTERSTHAISGAALLEYADRLVLCGERLIEAPDCAPHGSSEGPYEREFELVATYRRASACVRSGAFEEAVDELSTCLERDPEFEPALFLLAETLLTLGVHDEARVPLEALLARRPNAPEVLSLAGRLALALGDRQAARAALERALELDGTYARVLNDLAVLDWEEGRRDLALRRIRRAVDLDPEDADSLRNAAEMYRTLGMRRDARRFLERYLEVSPDDGAARDLLEAWRIEDSGAPLGFGMSPEFAD